jgi:hypothetical protein
MYLRGEGMSEPDKKEYVRWLTTSAENNNLNAITSFAKIQKRYRDGMSVKDLVIGEVIRRALSRKVADIDRLRADLKGVIDEMAEKGDSLAKLLHDAAELPKLKLADRFMT